MNRLLAAILNDDLKQVADLLQASPGLATELIPHPKLYDSKILHWIYEGDTALHLAAAGHRVELVQRLIASGANPNAASNHRRSTPLHYASDGVPTHSGWSAEKQVGTIQCLLRHGADLHAPDRNGATPLHRAVRTRCAAAVECLLQAGANPLAPNRSGSTAFHLAVQNTGRGGSGAEVAVEAQRQILRLFLSRGLNPDLRIGCGKSVRESAQSAWIRERLDSDPASPEQESSCR
jgi:hypothetical protein